MLATIIGKKLGQTQGFLEDGTRIPMTRIDVSGNVVSQIKTNEKDGYEAIQLGFGTNMKADKPTSGHAKKAGLTKTPRFFKETKADKVEEFELGVAINAEEVLSAGDIVDISGTSKGKGYAGVVKRHHFKGGPKTHGQSDRHRAPGSIGQSTTPGRVYKGKRMAGRMGVDNVTVKNLEVIELTDGVLLVKGLVPGHISSIVTITRRGENKKHIGLYKEEVEEITEKVEEVGESIEEQEALRQAQETQQRAEAVAEAKAEEKAEKEALQQVQGEAEQTENQGVDEEKVEVKAEEDDEKSSVDNEVTTAGVSNETTSEETPVEAAASDAEVSSDEETDTKKEKEEKSKV